MKGRLADILTRIMGTYVRYVSIFMIAFLFYHVIVEFTKFDLFRWIAKTFPATRGFSSDALEFSSLFCFYNIFIVGLLGIAMLFVSGARRLGLLGIIAAASFAAYYWQIGDVF